MVDGSLVESDFSVAGHREAMADVRPDLAPVEGIEANSDRQPLSDLSQLGRRKAAVEFRLTHEQNLQEFVLTFQV